MPYWGGKRGVMSEMDDLKRAMHHDRPPSRRELRAARTRAQALSPVRIVFSLLSLPIVALVVALSIYVRISPYEPANALAHLMARSGCDVAASVGLAPAYKGNIGYHVRNDADGDGVSCERAGFGVADTRDVVFSPPTSEMDAPGRMRGGAKFVKP